MATAMSATVHAPANYLEGDPAEPESIMDGRLDCEPEGLRFSSAGGELLLGIDSLLGISISGRTEARERNSIKGTMRVAGLSNGEPVEWVFAVDRSDAARLWEQLDQQRAARGWSALPHIEELVGFPSPRVTRLPAEAVGPPAPIRAAAELGHRLDGADRSARRKRRVWPWVALGAVLVALEVLVPLIILRGG